MSEIDLVHPDDFAKRFGHSCAFCPANCVCGDDHVYGGIACDNFHMAMGKKIGETGLRPVSTISNFMNRCRDELNEMKSPLKGMEPGEQSQDTKALYDRTDAINQRLDKMQENINYIMRVKH